MLTSRWNPWNELLSNQGRTEQFFNEAFGRSPLPEHVVHALPLDIRQTDHAFVIEASLPGFKLDDVEITFDETVLTIRGVRPARDETKQGGYVQRERHLNSVERHVYLPAQVRPDDISASFDNGVLTIVVPREQKAQPKRIQVTAGLLEEPMVIDAPVGAGASASS
jgi:HSP20 family protein